MVQLGAKLMRVMWAAKYMKSGIGICCFYVFVPSNFDYWTGNYSFSHYPITAINYAPSHNLNNKYVHCVSTNINKTVQFPSKSLRDPKFNVRLVGHLPRILGASTNQQKYKPHHYGFVCLHSVYQRGPRGGGHIDTQERAFNWLR